MQACCANAARNPSLQLLLGAVFAFLLAGPATAAPVKNGFDLGDASIPADEILPGGPPRDGIPAIDDPVFLSASDAARYDPERRVLGVARNGTAKAYPIGILNWHEIVNDRFGADAIAVTFCPLCGTGMAFIATVDGQASEFGVSGLLYNSDVLLYDRNTESLWSQVMRQAVSGPQKGQRLEMVVTAHTTWGEWRSRHPDSLLLSEETGHFRNYARNPYAGYEKSRTVYFPVAEYGTQYHPKEQVLGVELNGEAKCYPFVELSKAGAPIEDSIGGEPVSVVFDPEHRTGRVLDQDGREVPTVIAFWFAWAAFYPQGDVFTAAD